MRPLAAALIILALGVVACTGDPEPTAPPQTPTPTATLATVEATPTLTQTPTGTPTATPPAEVTPIPPLAFTLETFDVPAGARPHDVAPAHDGGVWYTAQGQGALGHLDPTTGDTEHIALGAGSAPHGVIVGPEGDAWITDGGLNAIVRVAAGTHTVEVFPLPPDRPGANLNTAAFDGRGRIWFTGQAGVVGVLDPVSGEMNVFDAPRGRGPYGITATPDGQVWFSSLAGSYIARVDLDNLGEFEVVDPPTADAGLRRVWSDSQGRLWVSQWNAGQVGVYDPSDGSWLEWPLPASGARAYAVYVDELDAVWLSDFTSDSVVRFDPATEEFEVFELPGTPGNVRQMLGRDGEVWAPESAADRLVVIRYRPEG